MKAHPSHNEPEGTILGRYFSNGETISVTWKQGTITEIVTHSQTAAAPPELWLAPGIVDPQINGFAGIDFQQDSISLSEFEHATAQLVSCGCLQFMPTLITDHWDRVLAKLKHLKTLKSRSTLLQSAILGWHIEGPFLSELPGFHGAHPRELMTNPRPHHVSELRSVAKGDLVLLTLAPEREGACEAIRSAVENGFLVSAGHSDADETELANAFEAGLRGFTHLGNACPQLLDRHDNIIWRVLDHHGLRPSVIPDGIHVSPALFRILNQILGQRLFCTTDAMAAAGAGPGRFKLGKLELEVGVDGIARQPGAGNFAGSSITPIEGVKRAARMLGKTWQEVWDLFSFRPAAFLGLEKEIGIRVGNPARFCLVKEHQDQEAGGTGFTIKRVVF